MNRSSHWRRCSTKIDILQNSHSSEYQADCMIKFFEKYQWRSLKNYEKGRKNYEKERVMCDFYVEDSGMFRIW